MRTGLLTVRCCKPHQCELAVIRRDDHGVLYAQARTRTEALEPSGGWRWETDRLRQRLDVPEPVVVDCGHDCLLFGHGPLLSAAEIEDAIRRDTGTLFLG